MERQKMIPARLKWALAIVVCVLLVAAFSVGWPHGSLVMADSCECLEPSCLVVINYENWDDLQPLEPLGLHLLNWRGDKGSLSLAAIVTPQELATVHSLGFDARVLDAPATPEQYYLVTLPRSVDRQRPSTAPLYQHGQVFPYAAGSFILKAVPAEAENLPTEGFFIQKLFGPIVLPTSPPSASSRWAKGSGAIPEYDPLIQELVNMVSKANIHNTIRALQDDDYAPGWDAGRSRFSYSSELEIERDYIRNRMEAMGLDVRYQNFNYGWLSLANIEGTLSGSGPGSDTVYIVCAHYDSISNRPHGAAPGADDNASGTAAVLEAARVLSQYNFNHTLRFVVFPAEEQGIIGSYHYASEARLAGTNIGGVINHDMIAWDYNGDDVMEIHTGIRGDSQALGTAFMNAMTTYGISLAPRYIAWGATTESDHSRFWGHGYPAILVIEDSTWDFNPFYHTTKDKLGLLDMPYATKIVQTTVATLAELAEIIPPPSNTPTPPPTR